MIYDDWGFIYLFWDGRRYALIEIKMEFFFLIFLMTYLSLKLNNRSVQKDYTDHKQTETNTETEHKIDIPNKLPEG